MAKQKNSKAKAEKRGVARTANAQAVKIKKSKTRKEPAAKKRSALNAAAQVLEEADQPMSCSEMIAAMAAKGYWTSPAGKTPQATLHSAIARDRHQGKGSPFPKD